MNESSLYNEFLEIHKPQLISSGVPEHFWKTVFFKITNDVFDAGNDFSLMLIDYSESDTAEHDDSPVFTLCVSRPEGIKVDDNSNIYLIDHAWTFRLNQVHEQLSSNNSLADRMCTITGIDLEDPNRIAKIEEAMWKYGQAYSLSSDDLIAEERVPIWYIMDEVGSAVNHSDDPNFRIVPFLHLTSSITYSLLFPLKNCEEDDQVVRDFAENVSNPDRNALLLPWRQKDFSYKDYSQNEPEEKYFLSGHVPESLPESILEPDFNRDEPLKVFTEYDVIAKYLKDPCFEIVDNKEEADVLWLITHFKNFAELSINSPKKFINQFPYEFVITVKDTLSVICRRKSKDKHHSEDTLETYPKWLPTTYNLKTEITEFVSYFQNREKRQLDNHWIVKPWNLARSLDTHITNNLNKIIRLTTTGPKIAQKYLENPVLFYRDELGAKVKFDIRYVLLIKNLNPLEAYIHRKFFLRFSNKEYALDSFDDYEKHFTVMNYTQNAPLKHIKCEEFVDIWKEQYPEHTWESIESAICEMLNEVLLCALEKEPPCGIGSSAQSRALFAADIMLDWNDNNCIQPKLLEVNWMPDCKRACEYYLDFFNDIFKLLFLNVKSDENFRLISNV